MASRRWIAVAAASVAILSATACDTRERIEERYRDVSSHEAYERALRQAGLESNAVARLWSEAATASLRTPLRVTSPFEEEGILDPADPRALAFRVEARRGQRIEAEVEVDGLAQGRVFMDLFRQPSDSLETPFHEAALLEGDTRLDYAVPRTGSFLIRVQPELLHGGRYRIQIRVLPTLAFPVEGRGPSAILSRFGASREGGRRSHRGVDIFAPRGTPALAAAPGRISRVDTTAIGGLVVWLREDGQPHSLYYAHLSRLLVREDQRVVPGDTVGLVGNTGNARTTPPHLHFAVYRRREGALDPYAFIEPQDTVAPVRVAPDSLLGRWVRTTVPLGFRAAADRRAEPLRSLEPDVAAEVVGLSGLWARLRLPDRTEGYARVSQLSAALDPIDRSPRLGELPRIAPTPEAPRFVDAREWATEEVVGHFDGYGLLLSDDGRPGWVDLDG